MSCNDIRPLLEAYALGVLEDDEVTRVDEHLARCDACRRLVDEYTAAAHALPEALAAVSRLHPSSELKARLLRAVESDAAATPTPPPAAPGRSSRAGRPMRRRRYSASRGDARATCARSFPA
jgi:anti-sigma factor RsiW